MGSHWPFGCLLPPFVLKEVDVRRDKVYLDVHAPSKHTADTGTALGVAKASEMLPGLQTRDCLGHGKFQVNCTGKSGPVLIMSEHVRSMPNY